MNPLKKQTVPGSLGGAISIIWMIYGDWGGLVPPELSQTQELTLTAAIALVATALVNLILKFLK